METTGQNSDSNAFSVTLYVSNQPGVLNRLALVFSRRGWNIDSLSVSPDRQGRFSRCSIAARGDSTTFTTIVAQLNKLVDVLYAHGHQIDTVVSRELALMKLGCPPPERGQIAELLGDRLFREIDSCEKTVTLEVVGTRDEINEVYDLLSGDLELLEIVRTGGISLVLGDGYT